jgi:hypothetical protein
MAFRSVVGLLGGASLLLVAGLSHAECTKDTDCKGDRICEQGVCTSPPPTAVAAPIAPSPSDAPPAPVIEPAPAAPAPAPVSGPRVIQVEDAPIRDERGYSVAESDERRNKRNWKRHSTGMMVGGIVMTSLSSVAFAVSLLGGLANATCSNRYDYDGGSSSSVYTYNDCDYDGLVYGGLVTGIILVGVGIPLIVIGAKREPRGTASVAPWATPNAGGLSLRLSL